jgi:hypothetical protein
MARGKGVTKLLLDASQAAMFAGIEIHNKPNISYRYPTAIILIINAWELALKAYVYKFIGKKKIYEEDGKHTISFKKANGLVKESVVSTDKNHHAVYANLEKLNEYRCSNVHYANSDLDPVIFMLMAKSVLNYHDFLKKYFNKDVSNSDNLIILPVGFKLPFDPIDYLKQDYGEAQNDFVNDVIQTIRELKENDIEDSIVIGFSVFTESIKKVSNADIIAAIDQANGTVQLTKTYRVTDDPSAPLVRMEPNLPPLRYEDVKTRVKQQEPDLKFDKTFHAVMREIKKDKTLCQVRYLDPRKQSGTKTEYYTETAIAIIIQKYKAAGNS